MIFFESLLALLLAAPAGILFGIARRCRRSTDTASSRAHQVSADSYLLLQEELDWRELTLLPEDDRRIEES